MIKILVKEATILNAYWGSKHFKILNKKFFLTENGIGSMQSQSVSRKDATVDSHYLKL